MERLTDLLAGSPRRALVVGALVVAAAIGVVLLAASVGDLRHANLPDHPWPPPGTYRNPLDPTDQDDLLSSAEATRVKADLLNDGEIELRAFEQGDVEALSRSRTGNALGKVQELVASNNALGIAEREEIHRDSIVVGRLPNPNEPAAGPLWCVEERGSGSITYFSKATGATVRTQTLSFDYRFWLVLVGQRYLITDVEAR